MSIRVCQLITELRPAGAERCVFELASRLPRDEFHVEVAALRGGAVADELARAAVRTHVLNVCCKLDVQKFVPLVRILRQGRFDILHTHLFHADLAGRLASRVAKTPHLVHSIHVVERRWRPWRHWWVRSGEQRYDRIVCVSEGARRAQIEQTHLPAEKYQVIHNGVDVERYAAVSGRRSQQRSKWGIADGDVLCAFVGRLDKQKGIETLLAAFAAAAGERSSVKLVIAGDGPLHPHVQRWVRKQGMSGRVRLLGFTNDVPMVLAAADIFLQPSRWEGFCLAAAEAMAAGLPVLGTDVPGLNEVVADGQTGLLCSVGDVQALSRSILRLVDDACRRRALGASGRQRVRDMFTLERFVSAHAALYRQLVAS